MKLYEAAGPKTSVRVLCSGSSVRAVGMPASRGRRNERSEIRRQGQGYADVQSAAQLFWEGARIEPALWLKAIYFDSGVVQTPQQAIAKMYDSMPGIERPDFVPS